MAPRHARVDMRHEILQQAQSLFALLVDGHLQRVAVGRHGAQRVARWHHLGSGGGQQAGDLTRAHAGGLLDQLALALRVQQRSRRRAGRQLRERIIPERFRRLRSGTQRLRWSGDRQHGRGHGCWRRRLRREIRRRQRLWSRTFVRCRRGGSDNGSAGGRRKPRGAAVQLRPRQQRAVMPGAAVLRNSVARHRHHGRVHRRRITGALEHWPVGGASPGVDWRPRSPRSPASPGSAGGPSCLVRPAESWS